MDFEYIKKSNNEEYYLLQFDGGSRSNPGEAGSGAVLYDKNNNKIFEVGVYKEYATNNQAEYLGLIYGLKKAKKLGIKNIFIEGDSQLVIKQLLNKYKIKNEELKKYYDKIYILFEYFDSIAIKHIYRKYNYVADLIVNEVISNKYSVYRLWKN